VLSVERRVSSVGYGGSRAEGTETRVKQGAGVWHIRRDVVEISDGAGLPSGVRVRRGGAPVAGDEEGGVLAVDVNRCQVLEVVVPATPGNPSPPSVACAHSHHFLDCHAPKRARPLSSHHKSESKVAAVF